jgi:hypothetical protein
MQTPEAMEYHDYPEDVPMENVQYQWPGEPSVAEQPQDINMAIDPRLCGDALGPWDNEPLSYARENVPYAPENGPPLLANQQLPFQEHLDFSEPFSNPENEGIFSDEEEEK